MVELEPHLDSDFLPSFLQPPYMHLSKARNSDGVVVKLVEQILNGTSHIREEQFFEIFIRRRNTFILQRPHSTRPFDWEHYSRLTSQHDKTRIT